MNKVKFSHLTQLRGGGDETLGSDQTRERTENCCPLRKALRYAQTFQVLALYPSVAFLFWRVLIEVLSLAANGCWCGMSLAKMLTFGYNEMKRCLLTRLKRSAPLCTS